MYVLVVNYVNKRRRLAPIIQQSINYGKINNRHYKVNTRVSSKAMILCKMLSSIPARVLQQQTCNDKNLTMNIWQNKAICLVYLKSCVKFPVQCLPLFHAIAIITSFLSGICDCLLLKAVPVGNFGVVWSLCGELSFWQSYHIIFFFITNVVLFF